MGKTMGKKIAILGNGIAGYSAAKEIRKYQPDGESVMISEETELPYLRPLLSKTYFKTLQRQRLQIAGADWYEENHIRIISGRRIHKILAAEKRVLLDDCSTEDYDACIYALGAHNYIPPFAGASQTGVLSIRTIADFNQIRRYMMAAHAVVVIGGGVIGLEMAWEMAQMDCDVTVLEAGPRLMGRILDNQSANLLAEKSQEKGILVHTSVEITELTGNGKVTGVKLSDGSFFPTDLVIISCGIRANIEAAENSGILCEQGVLVNEYPETNLAGIYGAGDCIRGNHINPGLWNYARFSGEIAGYNAIFPARPRKFHLYSEPVILNAMRLSLFSIGNVDTVGEATIVNEGSLDDTARYFKVNHHAGEAFSYSKRFYKEGKLCGAVLIGDLTQMEDIKGELIREEG